MKKAKRKSTFWLMGGLAALTFLSSGSIVAAQTVTSYNDLAWDTGQLDGNITKITSPNPGGFQPFTGQLKDFDTGLDTAVTLTVAGGFFDGTPSATQGLDPTMGTDAFTAFDGKVSGQGVLSYINMVGSDLVLTFTNMDPNKVYDLTFFGHRDANAWDRASLVTISGHDAFVNTSSVATDNPDTGTYPGGVLFTGPSSPSTRLPSDNDNGYVARFSNVKSGSDGTVVLTISFDGTVGEQFKGKYGSAVRLVESGNTSNHHFGDLDGNGTDDIVWRETSIGDVAVWLGNGVNAPTTTGLIGGAPTTWTIVGIGDMDGNGTDDIVWHEAGTGSAAVWLGNGVNAPTTTGLIGSAPTTWTIVGIGDMDGNGTDDIVWRESGTGSVAVWLGNGVNAPTTTGLIGGAPTTWAIVGIGDTDGNGTDDIVWHEAGTGSAAVWLGNGVNAPTTTGLIGGAPTTWTIVGIGDTDGNGTDDIVWHEAGTGSAAVWLGNGVNAPTTTGLIGGAPTTWTIVGIGDTDGNGTDDIVWHEAGTGSAAVWLGNGVNAPTTTGLIGGAPIVWEIRP